MVQKIKDKCKFQDKEYSNVIDLYNKYYSMYIKLINDYDRVTYMNYYDFIQKDKVFDYISNKLLQYNLHIKSDNNILSILDKPAKSHGKTVKSAEEAINKKIKCFNRLNNNIKIRNTIKKNLNVEILAFFENN